MLKRRRLKPTDTLKDRLISFAKEAREKASQLQSCPEKDELLRRARQAEIAAHLDNWATSPGLQPPK
ncbi:hypothetical protein [Bradyrhizobium sp. Tv2a-2]|uniref:hypothetical protein n=1 Tax=Bradyrhizobium sp. Tv2a-2 TaxID=113395 RepID=UPI00040EFF7C|nr:hypothetical protein [Bradyrhizobium sp. Tv2a-2]